MFKPQQSITSIIDSKYISQANQGKDRDNSKDDLKKWIRKPPKKVRIAIQIKDFYLDLLDTLVGLGYSCGCNGNGCGCGCGGSYSYLEYRHLEIQPNQGNHLEDIHSHIESVGMSCKDIFRRKEEKQLLSLQGKLWRMKTCSRDWFLYLEGHKHKHRLYPQPIGCQERTLCPICSVRYSLDKARETFDELLGLYKARRNEITHWGLLITFTIPSELSMLVENWLYTNPSKFKEFVDFLFTSSFDVLKEVFNEQIGVISSINLNGEEDFGKPHYHIHSFLLPLGVKRFQDKEVLDRLRDEWKRKLEGFFGKSLETAVVNVEYISKGSIGKLWHVVWYLYRPYLWDYWKALYDGYEVEEGFDRLITRVSLASRLIVRRIRRYGIIANRVKQRLGIKKKEKEKVERIRIAILRLIDASTLTFVIRKFLEERLE